MFDWLLRIMAVSAAFLMLHIYVEWKSGSDFAPVSPDAVQYSLLRLWRAAMQVVDKLDWIIFSPLTVGFVFVVVLAWGLIRPLRR